MTLMPLGMLRWPHIERCFGRDSKDCSSLLLGTGRPKASKKGGTSGDKVALIYILDSATVVEKGRM